MKIVKSFSSNDYANVMHSRYTEGSALRKAFFIEPFLEWGLSSDGNLCCRGNFADRNYPDWTEYEDCVFSISLDEMKKIVKELGHLVMFI